MLEYLRVSTGLGVWVGMVQEETMKALGAWVEGDPQSSGVPKTGFSLSHSLALSYDGA